MRHALPPRARRRGATLLELLISTAILGLVLAAASLLGSKSQDLYRAEIVGSELEAQGRRAMERIVTELRRSGTALILPPDPAAGVGGSRIDYSIVLGQNGGVVDVSTPFRISFEYEDGELDNGIDDDGDGLVDEGMVVWTRDVGLPTERSTVLCRNVRELSAGEIENGLDDDGDGFVDERGLWFERVGTLVSIQLTLEKLDHDRRPVTRTITTSLRLRN